MEIVVVDSTIIVKSNVFQQHITNEHAFLPPTDAFSVFFICFYACSSFVAFLGGLVGGTLRRANV